MSYHHTIHRRADKNDLGDDISEGEWLAIVRADPSLSLMPAEASIPAWVKWSGPTGAEAGFNWNDGVVWGWRLSDEGIAKACQIAEALGARVQGDENEFYRPDGSEIEC